MTSLSQDEARVQLAASLTPANPKLSAYAKTRARDDKGKFLTTPKLYVIGETSVVGTFDAQRQREIMSGIVEPRPDFDQDDLVPDPETSMAVPVIACVVLVVVLAAICVWRMVHG